MNKAISLLLSLTAALLPVLVFAQSDLSQYRNKNRVLLVFAPSKTDPRWQRQNTLLQRSAAAFRDRDLLRFDVFGNSKSLSKLRLRYGVSSGSFVCLLIGKDGSVASSDSAPISLSELTARIDRMPMRREEMQRRGRR